MTSAQIEPVDKPIKAVLSEFLEEQRKRLKSPTFGKYESVICLLEASMNGYAYQYLNDAEVALFDSLYNAEGPGHREFCEMFGPEKIPENVHEFVNYFMPHKVMCGKELLRAAGTVTKKLGKWLQEKGYAGQEEADHMAGLGARASKDLPAAATLAEVLADHADGMTADFDQTVEGHFMVEAVGPASLTLASLISDKRITVPVPEQATRACREGWTVCGRAGKTARGWRLVEVWNVYP